MEVRYNNKICIFAPLSSKLDKRVCQRLFSKLSAENRQIALDLSYVNDCTVDFCEALTDLAKEKNIGIFNIPSDIFAIPDEQQGFDPAVSDYRTVILFKLNQIMFNLDITIRVIRPDRTVVVEALITMSRLALKEYVPIKEDYRIFRMTFNQISEVRKELA